jgi:hypothetical protein
MIHNVITSIAINLDEFIKNKLSINDDTVIVSSLVDIKGNLNQDVENKISMFLIHIEEETITKNATKFSQGNTPPIKINIMLMFSAYFPNFNYVEALRYISLVIEFFQKTNIFDDSNTQGLPQNANRIHCELFNIPIDEIGKLWSNIGANYVPSVCYKFKQILFDGDNISQDIPRILGVSKKSFNLLDDVDAADVKNSIENNDSEKL